MLLLRTMWILIRRLFGSTLYSDANKEKYEKIKMIVLKFFENIMGNGVLALKILLMF